MANIGKFDDAEFQRFVKQFDTAAQGKAVAKIMNESMKKAIVLVMNGVKGRTPTDTGALRRGWYAGQIKSTGKSVSVDISNYKEYAPHIEYGHRTRGGGGFVPGQYMLTNTIKEVQSQFEQIAANALEQYLNELLGG